MFTGIIKDIGTVHSIEKTQGWRIGIATDMDLTRTEIGASICCSGCCLTAVQIQKNLFFSDVSPETLNRTMIGSWRVGTRINLEPSLRLGDELGGHFVFGHVDGLAEIEFIEPDEQSWNLSISAPAGLMRYIAVKGSVALDGISLTVNTIEHNRFGVTIVPHTWAHTTLNQRRPGDKINLEVDMLARYVERMVKGA